MSEAGTTRRVRRWVRPEIRGLEPYHVADARGMIKLDAMENPYPWPEAMRREWLEALSRAQVNRYPDAAAAALQQALRDVLSIPSDVEVVLGNGSDELIQTVQLVVGGPGRAVLAPVPTFAMYEMTATVTGGRFEGVPLDERFGLDVPAMLEAIERVTPACVFLTYPNNPTGNLFDVDAVEAVIEATDGLVVIDEAYHAYAKESFLSRVGQYENVVVMRTLSKIGLAGLRVGLLAGPIGWVQQFDKVRLPYNIGVLNQLSVAVALRHVDALNAQASAICAERDRLFGQLSRLDGLEVYPSRANFLLLRVRERDVDAVFRGLCERGVLVKNLSRPGSALAGCLRVSVGLAEENDAFLAALGAVLSA